ncbi:MAG TPA: FRG domain-containing protein [Candidatus Binatia bacterium]|nr:FRG domain-containing protein [Candidatus Binatia bacterium]
MRYKDHTIRSVAQLLGALKRQIRDGQTVWFRGHGVATWKLVPSLARRKSHLRAENAVIKRFMQNATPHLQSQPQEEWEWMFLMQHYRAPTRLLDWTESALAALYFAVSKQKHNKQDGAVWCLDPIALNKAANIKFSFELEIPSFGQDKSMENYLPTRVHEGTSELNPVAIMGPRNTPRMAAQLGTFTINHRLHGPIETIGTSSHVWRWIIPAEAKKELLKELAHLGFTELTLFPELEKVADLSKELLP